LRIARGHRWRALLAVRAAAHPDSAVVGQSRAAVPGQAAAGRPGARDRRVAGAIPGRARAGRHVWARVSGDRRDAERPDWNGSLTAGPRARAAAEGAVDASV